MLLDIDNLGLISFLECIPRATNALEQGLVIAAARYVRSSILSSNPHLKASRHDAPNPRSGYHFSRHGTRRGYLRFPTKLFVTGIHSSNPWH